MNTALPLVAATLPLLLAAPAAAEIQFAHHFADTDGPVGGSWGSNVIGDFDGDGNLDVAMGKSQWGEGEPRVVLYRNLGAIDQWSEPIVLAKEINSNCGAIALDLNGDGRTDFAGKDFLLNAGGDPAKFERGTWNFGNQVHDMEAADFDGDGQLEVVLNLQHSPKPAVMLFRKKPGSGPADPWERTRILDVKMKPGSTRKKPMGEVHAAISPRGIGDLDGDGDLDIAWVGSWLENADGKGRQWRNHENLTFKPDGKWGRAVRCWVADIDGDGANDIVQTVCDAPGQPVVWMRNAKGDGSVWEERRVPYAGGEPGDFHSLVVADFDLDGDMDIYADEMEHLHVPLRRVGKIAMIVWENLDGKGGDWKQQNIVTGLGGHQAQAADLDGDGDIDIVTRPFTAANVDNGGKMHVSVLENLAK